MEAYDMKKYIGLWTHSVGKKRVTSYSQYLLAFYVYEKRFMCNKC
jgi:hypothetical protein